MPEFPTPKSVLSSPAVLDEPFARSSAPFQAHSSNVEDGQSAKSAKRRHNGSHGGPLFQPILNTASGNFPPAENMSAGLESEESIFQVQSSSDLEGPQTSPSGVTYSLDDTSLIGKTVVDSHVRGDVSSTISLSSAEQERCYYPVDVADARKATPARPVQVAFSDSSVPSNEQVLELLEIFFTSYHPFLPCIHQKTFVERVKRRGLTGSDPLLVAILAVAAPAHSDHRLQALQKIWLSRARLLFDKDLNASTFPTQSLQAAVWIVFCAYISGDLTEAWFFLGRACRLAHFLGFDRIDCGRSERLISMAPRPRDAMELEERRKTIWVLFFLDRSLSCLAGFSLAIDDRCFDVNYPVEDGQFQAFIHSVSLARHSLVRQVVTRDVFSSHAAQSDLAHYPCRYCTFPETLRWGLFFPWLICSRNNSPNFLPIHSRQIWLR